MGIADFIGGRGEAIAFMRLARIWRDDVDQPYFWPRYLGEKGKLFELLQAGGAGITLTETFAMLPAASVSGIRPTSGPSSATRRSRTSTVRRDHRRTDTPSRSARNRISTGAYQARR